MWHDALLYIFAFALAVFLYGLRPANRWQYRNYPGPKPSWLIGCAASILGSNQIYQFRDWCEGFGPQPFAVDLGAKSMVVLSDPDEVRTLLHHSPARPDINSESIVPRKPENDPNDSLLWSRDDKYRSLKAAWQPVFFSGSLKGYMKIMDDAAKLLLEEISETVDGKDRYFNIYPMIQAMSMSVIAQAAFGVELHTQKCDKSVQTESERKRSADLLKAAKASLLPAGNTFWVIVANLFPFLAPVIRPLAKLFPDPLLRTFVNGQEFVNSIVQDLLKDHQAAVNAAEQRKGALNGNPEHVAFHNGEDKENKVNGNHTNGSESNGVWDVAAQKENVKAGANGVKGFINDGVSDGGKPYVVDEIRKGVKPGSFIDLLVQGSMRDTGHQFTHNEKAQQVLLMLMAGYDTSANTLTFASYTLSRPGHAEIQRKLIEEVDSLGPDYTPDYDDLEHKLPYMDAVIKETLRLYPAGHLLIRDTTDNLQMKNRVLPKGTFAAVSVYAIHHDKRIWGESVEDFVPERWLAQDPASLKAAQRGFFAFGGGPRGCPGSRFALLEIKSTLIRIFQNFTLELGPQQEPLELRSTITLGPMHGVFVRAVPRAKRVQA